MSTPAMDASYEAESDHAARYLGTIHGCPLVWDDQDHCPVWPEGEPMDVIYEPDGGITIEPRCDVYQAWWDGPGKPMDCGHMVQAPALYVTWLETHLDHCITCAQDGHR